MRTVKSIHDFKDLAGEPLGFDTTGIEYRCAHWPCTESRKMQTNNHEEDIRGIENYVGVLWLCFGSNSRTYRMIPESELIAKGIISPVPPYCVAGCDGVNLGYCETNERGCFENRQPAVEEKLKSRTPEIETKCARCGLYFNICMCAVPKRAKTDVKPVQYEVYKKADHAKQSEIDRLYPELNNQDTFKLNTDNWGEPLLTHNEVMQRMVQREAEEMDRIMGYEPNRKEITGIKGFAEISKPAPILKPRRVIVSERIKEIVTAISQLDTMQEVIPQEWLDELVELNEWLKTNRKC